MSRDLEAKPKIESLKSRGLILHEGNFFEMPCTIYCGTPKNEEYAAVDLTIWKGFGFGIKGEKGFD